MKYGIEINSFPGEHAENTACRLNAKRENRGSDDSVPCRNETGRRESAVLWNSQCGNEGRRRMTVKSIKELIQAADAYDAVSFDIFDTLIMRRTLFPEDVFIIVEQKLKARGFLCDFAANRKRAVLENTIPNPNIYEIYNQFAEFTDCRHSSVRKFWHWNWRLKQKFWFGEILLPKR